MSSCSESVLGIPQRTYVLVVNKSELENSARMLYEQVYHIHTNEIKLYSWIGSLAITLADTPEGIDPNHYPATCESVEMILGYINDSLVKWGYTDPCINNINSRFMLAAARTLSSYIPRGVWVEMRAVSVAENLVYYVGTHLERDHR